ncbi:MAG: magnesium transporter CorA family protein [Deltaproteobacteria bacterium]|jgi:magnesium transporter|nr:magnesium transporter CorA family protein [Deltaproteobacteria bacterium]
MISKYQLVNNGFWPVPAGQPPDWVDLENPNSEELTEISGQYSLPPLFLVDPLDPRERPHTDTEEGAMLIIVRVPLFRQNGGRVFATIPLGVIITPERVFTVCREAGLAKQFIARQMRQPRQISRDSILFKILIGCSSDFIHQLEVLEEMAENAEQHLIKSQQNDQIITLLTIEKALINFSVALHSNRSIMERIMGGILNRPLGGEEASWLDFALTENQQAIFTVEIFGQIVGSMGDAFGIIISNNLNKVMKFLTGVTIILMVPTLIVGAYGMNVRLPLADSAWAFAILSLACLGLSVFIWRFFSRRKWI